MLCLAVAGKPQDTHLSGLWLAVPQHCDKVLTVASGHVVRQLLAHQPARLPHDDVALARLVLVIQEVVDLETIRAGHFPDLLTPHARRVGVQEHRHVAKRA